MPIIIELTENQKELLEPLFQQALKAEKPGMILAQIGFEEMKVGYIEHEYGLKIQSALGCPHSTISFIR